MAVTKGAAEEGGGGIGKEETNCMDFVSTMEMELPEGNARRPWELRSEDPKLLRLGGPGSIESHDSCNTDDDDDGNCDDDDDAALGLANILFLDDSIQCGFDLAQWGSGGD